jgi:DNA-binding response OmpR family regulator
MTSTNETAAPRVLVVEDESLIALLLAEQLESEGFEVVGPATTVAKALRLLDKESCDLALLDIRLGAQSAEPVANALRARGTPFVTVSGYAPDQRAAAFEGAPMLVKPVRMKTLMTELRRCLAKHRLR